MKTDRPAGKAPRARVTSSLTPYLATVLAGTYVIAFWAFAGRTPAATEGAAPEPEAQAGGAQALSVIWYQDLPVGERPVVQAPPGWRLATSEGAVTQPVRRAVPVVARATPGRVRTRSS